MTQVNMELKDLARNFVANMHILRKENELSYRAMGRAVNVSDSTVRRIEGARKTRFGRGQQGYIPSLATVVKVAQATGLTAGDLLTGRLG